MKLDRIISERLTKKEEIGLWVVLGPTLLAFSLTVLLLKISLFVALSSLLSMCGVVCAWKYSLKGAAIAISSLLITFLMFSLFIDRELFSWEIFGFLSMIVTLSVIGLSALEYRASKQELDNESESRFLKLRHDYEHQLSMAEISNEELKNSLLDKDKTLACLHEEMKGCEKVSLSLKQECDHYLEQVDHLKEESLELQRSLLKHEACHAENEELKKEYQKNLKELNTIRVDYFQQRLLLEHARVASNEIASDKPTVERVEVTDIEVLEEERASLKKHYKQQIRDYKGLQERLKAVFSVDQLDEHEHGFPEYYEGLKVAFQDMTRNLQETRMEIFKTEGSILELKKMQSSLIEASPAVQGSYLAIADQECLRLEEENILLLDLLESLFQAYSKK